MAEPLTRYWLPPGADVGFDVAAVRRDFPILRRRVHGQPLVWLDNGATTQKPRQVVDALAHHYLCRNSNVHRGAHTLAAEATDAYERARAVVARFIGADRPEEIVFVRGTTEGVNLVAYACGRTILGPGDEVVLTTLEHHSNIVPWQQVCAERNARLRVVPIDDAGDVRLDEYTRILGPRTKIVAFAHVSNVLGTVLPVAEMTALAHAHGARVVVDGAQAVAHLPVDVTALGVDFYVFSGHKVFGPTGIGVLYGRYELLDRMPPWQGGGSMISDVTFDRSTFRPPPYRFEAGTGHIAGAVGLAAALDYLDGVGRAAAARHTETLTRHAVGALAGIPGLRLIGTPVHQVGAVTFTLDDEAPEHTGARLDRAGIAVRAGHHCAQPTLRRYGVESAVRLSVALYNTTAEIDRTARIVSSGR